MIKLSEDYEYDYDTDTYDYVSNKGFCETYADIIIDMGKYLDNLNDDLNSDVINNSQYDNTIDSIVDNISDVLSNTDFGLFNYSWHDVDNSNIVITGKVTGDFEYYDDDEIIEDSLTFKIEDYDLENLIKGALPDDIKNYVVNVTLDIDYNNIEYEY